MKSVIYEYSDAIVAIVGAIGVLQLFAAFFTGESSIIAGFLAMVLQGGI